jgi:hypothetical protein
MFKKLSPQKVQHDSGYIVQVASRTSVEYLDANRKATVDVDFAASIGIYRKTLRGWLGMNDDDKNEVLNRIVAGLKAMGSDVELC